MEIIFLYRASQAGRAGSRQAAFPRGNAGWGVRMVIRDYLHEHGLKSLENVGELQGFGV
ncbi:hypothetical protein [Herminiimonas sp.]|uniref:hypothetical protein n=1 Tax=Herminiimonas sp. TaxID=1926289 RepID=UPI00272DAB17|nr:hypothetical protein [Herminiimonas sp.]